MTPGFAELPEPPYYAVIFSSQRTPGEAGYGVMADRMMELAEKSAGFLGAESARSGEGFGITVCYWRSLEEIAAWKRDAEHQVAQKMGRDQWYAGFRLRVAKVERAEGWDKA